jgi:hypothetical protein
LLLGPLEQLDLSVAYLGPASNAPKAKFPLPELPLEINKHNNNIGVPSFILSGAPFLII